MLRLLAAWTVLNLLFNVRYPAREPMGWYLLPSLDATVILAALALLARARRRLPRTAIAALAVAVVVVRVFRIGDGVTRRYFNQPLNLALDLPMSSELGRLLDATLPRLVLLVAVPLALAALAGIGFAVARALRASERAFAVRTSRQVFIGVCALSTLSSPFWPAARDARDDRRVGGFGASVVPRLARETAFALGIDRYRAVQAANIAATDARLRALPHDLRRLAGNDLLLFFVESYGAAAIDRPELARLLEPTYRDAAAALERQGFVVASGLLDSPTTSGRSWLGHEALTTGVRSSDRIIDELVQRAQPVTLATFFRQAGYRTVFAQPANRYRSIARWVYDFDAVYSGWDLGYRGPGFLWANIPDQYTIDFIHRHELAPGHAPPRLLAYALVSSHAPWSEQPRLVDDWSSLGDGAIYDRLPVDHFPVTWTTLAKGGPAYIRSVAYDLRVLVDYLGKFVAGDTLVIVLGDHQPVAEITDFSLSHAVPVHVLSRRRAFIEPFLARGYLPGIRARRTDSPVRGMETFLPDLLVDFSTAAAQ